MNIRQLNILMVLAFCYPIGMAAAQGPSDETSVHRASNATRYIDTKDTWTSGIDISPDGKLVATSCQRSGSIQIFDIQSGERTLSYRPGISEKKGSNPVFHPTENYVLIVGSNGDVKRFDLSQDMARGEKLFKVSGRDSRYTLDISPDGKYVAVGTKERVFIYDYAEKKRLHNLKMHGWARQVAFDTVHGKVAIGMGSRWNVKKRRTPAVKGVQVYDLTTGELTLELGGFYEYCTSLTFNSDCTELLASLEKEGGSRAVLFSTTTWDSRHPTAERRDLSVEGVGVDVYRCSSARFVGSGHIAVGYTTRSGVSFAGLEGVVAVYNADGKLVTEFNGGKCAPVDINYSPYHGALVNRNAYGKANLVTVWSLPPSVLQANTSTTADSLAASDK